MPIQTSSQVASSSTLNHGAICRHRAIRGRVRAQRRGRCRAGPLQSFGGVMSSRPAQTMKIVLEEPSVMRPSRVQQCLGSAAVLRLLPQQHVGEQRDRLDVAARPARVLAAWPPQGRRCSVPLAAALRIRTHECEHVSRVDRSAGGKQVIATMLRAARDLHIDEQLALVAALHQRVPHLGPPSDRATADCACAPHARLRSSRARCSRSRKGRPTDAPGRPRTHRLQTGSRDRVVNMRASTSGQE
jgi:hypothetical protein